MANQRSISTDAALARIQRMKNRDEWYLSVLTDPVKATRHCEPLFGRRGQRGVDLDEFQSIYGADLFYRTCGLNDPAVYAAHRAASVMTSMYRQLGKGARQLIRAILCDSFGVTDDEATWKVRGQDLGCVVRLRGDAGGAADIALRDWLSGIDASFGGVAIEVRQGMKTADARREHSYVEANAKSAVEQGLMPVLLLLSAQANEAAMDGYRAAGWQVLLGDTNGSIYDSSYGFIQFVTAFDLEDFLIQNHRRIDAEVGGVLRDVFADYAINSRHKDAA